jgi:hypothetical protein
MSWVCVGGENDLDREERRNFEQTMNGFSETGVGMPNVQRLSVADYFTQQRKLPYRVSATAACRVTLSPSRRTFL